MRSSLAHATIRRARLVAMLCVLAGAGLILAESPTATLGGPIWKCNGVPASIVGTPGRDELRGTRRSDVIVGRGGDDVIRGRKGGDLICGDRGDDRIRGGPSSDSSGGFGPTGACCSRGLFGGPGRDRLTGGVGNDFANGGRGADLVIGNEGIRDYCGGGPPQVDSGAGGDRADGSSCEKVRSARAI